ncbi:CKLF-like MARVEL transmembrane domain-containing protein 6 [Lithobates pipiens]
MTDPAYQATTEPLNKEPKEWCSIQIVLKACQLLLSLVAFICEEVITRCQVCSGLYIFEFVSCSAFLISLLMLVVYLSPLKNKINIPSFKKVDFYITLVTGVSFFIASIVFIATIDTSELAQVSTAFGFLASFAFIGELYNMWKNDYLQRKDKPKTTPNAEGEPLNHPVQENP